MKSVLLSIQPKWCELIASGKKTIEVRKTRPKIDTPFKVYIYCTLPPKEELFTHGRIREYANELLRLQDGRIVYGYGMQLCCDIEDRPYSQDNFLCKKVIGEFVCDEITNLFALSKFWLSDEILSDTCLSPTEIRNYANGADKVYGWHISDLKVYDEPKELSNFRIFCKSYYDGYKCDDCKYLVNYDCCEYDEKDCCCDGLKPLERPPLSWCYVNVSDDMKNKEETFTVFAYEDDGIIASDLATYDTAEEAIEFAKSRNWDEVVNDITGEVIYRR